LKKYRQGLWGKTIHRGETRLGSTGEGIGFRGRRQEGAMKRKELGRLRGGDNGNKKQGKEKKSAGSGCTKRSDRRKLSKSYENQLGTIIEKRGEQKSS